MPEPALKTEGLTKIYRGDLGNKPVVGLDNLSLVVEEGRVYAFLGPNGAGKTTTIKLLMRLLHPTKGKAWIFGRPNTSRMAMARVGYLPEQPSIYGYLTGVEFLELISRLFGLDASTRRRRIPDLLDRVGLGARGDQAIRGYSRGMVQRLGMAQALVNDPDLIVLDEPMTSLDPVGRKDFRDMIFELKERGKTVFFSSHILSDAEMIADRVCILNQGKLVHVGKLEQMVESQIASIEVTFYLNKEKHRKIDLTQYDPIVQDEKIMCRLSGEYEVQELLKKIEALGGRIHAVIPRKKTLEDVFMAEVRG